MSRSLDTATLSAAAQHYAALFLADSGKYDRKFVMEQFYNFTFLDEWDFMVSAVSSELGFAALGDFEARIAALKKKSPRDKTVFANLLADKLAIDIDGKHIPGRIGSTVIDARPIGIRSIEVETPDSLERRRRLRALGFVSNDAIERETHTRDAPYSWPIYAGETEERLANSGIADPLPDGTPGMPVGANVPRISNVLAIAMANQITLSIDEGTGAGVIQCRSGAQPAGVDVVVAGVLLATLVMTDPAFPAATDGAPGGLATASAIADDASADATGTLGYCRASSTNDSITPLDDHFDGEAGTASADYIFNTLAFVAGAVISMSSLTLTVPEG